MPLYEYRCEACQHAFEVIQKFSDGPISVCPACGQGPVEKLFSSPAIQFKGTGWYITDYARKGQTAQSDTTGSTNSGKSESGGGESATAKPSAEAGVTQPESKSDNKTENRIESKTAAASSKKE